MISFWQDHSLTIVMAIVGLGLTAFSFAFDEGQVFDLFLALGAGMLTVAALFFLSQFFREKTKPEDKPNDPRPSE